MKTITTYAKPEEPGAEPSSHHREEIRARILEILNEPQQQETIRRIMQIRREHLINHPYAKEWSKFKTA